EDECILFVAARDRVEPVHGPVELVSDLRPGELTDSEVMILSQADQPVAYRSVGLRRRHVPSLARRGCRSNCRLRRIPLGWRWTAHGRATRRTVLPASARRSAMAAPEHVVIIGGGLAGAKTAQALREQGFEGRVTIIAEERHLPYERPPLCKGYLAGETTFDDSVVHPADWYRDNDIDLRLGTCATGIDPAAHEVEVDQGD